MRITPIKRLFIVLLCAVSLFAAVKCSVAFFPVLAETTRNAAMFSAVMILTEGASALFERSSAESRETPAAVDEESAPEPAGGYDDPVSEAAEHRSVVPSPPENTAQIVSRFYSSKGTSFHWENVYVSNRTGKSPFDIQALLAARPPIKIVKQPGRPQVLLYHTHTTEAYLDKGSGAYPKDASALSRDENENVIRVGVEIEKKLNEAGIVTIHDKTIHDEPYTGAYERSAATIRKNLQKYPTIDVVLDLHRDSLKQDDGTQIKPVVEIEGKKAAQIMICAGCEDGDITGYPDWKINMRFALRIQKACEDTYPGLARPLYFCPRKYNQHLSHGALLIEMGGEGNSLAEAVYSGQLLGNILVKVLDGLQ